MLRMAGLTADPTLAAAGQPLELYKDVGPPDNPWTMRLYLLGSPASAVTAFEALRGGPHEIVGVIAPPDRPAGRGRRRRSPPVAAWARDRGLPLFQPESPNPATDRETIQSAQPDLLVVVAYGRLLGTALRQVAPLGAVNLHFSLLPSYRGAAPVVHALLHGETTTGVSVLRLVRELDAGPVLAQRKVSVREDDTAGTLEDRLAVEGGRLLAETLRDLAAGTAQASPQDESLATYAPSLRKEQGRMDWTRDAAFLQRFVRALAPWPGAFTFLHPACGDPIRLAVERLRPCHAPPEAGRPPEGAVGPITAGLLPVRCGGGWVGIERMRPAGRGSVDAAAFARGYPAAGARMDPVGPAEPLALPRDLAANPPEETLS